MTSISGQLVDVHEERIYPARVTFGKKIERIEKISSAPKTYLAPGFVDGHIHIESSMLIPSEFARLAIRHGTIGVVADPHEIANVLGVPGVLFMIRNARRTPMKFYFGASPCVPATDFETAGAELGPDETGRLLRLKDVTHLSEVMNYPAVIAREKSIMAKIALAKKYNKRVDGHAPGLRGHALGKYLSAGIETDHECFMLEEAMEKARKGMKILVREGSAAKNLAELHPLLRTEMGLLCSDDKHPDDLIAGHLDATMAKAVSLGIHPIQAISAATKRVVEHYRLGAGLLREGDAADIAVLGDLRRFSVKQTWINGKLVFNGKKASSPRIREKPINNFGATTKKPGDFAGTGGTGTIAIEAIDGEIVTNKVSVDHAPDMKKDVLKIAVVNRYRDAPPAIGFIKGFGIRRGAFGSSVMHDSHNIGIVGTDDASICTAANSIIKMKGGLAVFDGRSMHSLPLPFAGLMSGEDGFRVGKRYGALTEKVRRMGCRMHSPFMTLSFMALLVIPHIKLSDKGLFDGDRFRLIPSARWQTKTF
ncbi:MAG: adenine deaminase [Candidatus Micrarchaeota archaeon]